MVSAPVSGVLSKPVILPVGEFVRQLGKLSRYMTTGLFLGFREQFSNLLPNCLTNCSLSLTS